MDPRGIVHQASDSVKRVFGFSPQELIGQSVSGLVPTPYGGEHERGIEAYLPSGGPGPCGVTPRFEGLRRDGTTFPCEASIAKVEMPGLGEPLFACTVRDVTDRVAEEERLRLLAGALAAVGEAVIITDLAGSILYVNARFTELTGYTETEVLGRNPRLLKSGLHPDRFYEHMWRTLLHEGRWSGEITNRRKDGSFYECQLTLSTIEDNHAAPTGFVGIERDVTDRKRAQMLQEHVRHVDRLNLDLQQSRASLERAVGDLERSNRELDDFAYVASHDLKEPLRGIHTYANFLLEDCGEKLDAQAVERLQTLFSLTQRLQSLVDNLLYYSRVGRQDLAVEETDLHQVVEEVLESLRVTLEESGTEVRLTARLPVLTCDRARVGEIFRNLIVNAIKYNDKPQRWTEIGCVQKGVCPNPGSDSRAMGGKPPTVLYVRDNGIGIKQKHIGAVFTIFKRLHRPDAYGGGTGVGLTIVKKIVERHGGRIWVESALGHGTTFYFTLQRDA